MATKKTTAAEVKAAEVKEEKVVAEAPAATEAAEAPKKTTKKAAPAKKAAEKKPAAKKAAKADAQANIFIQYQGVELSYADLVERVKSITSVKSPKNINIYVVPENNKAYYVVDDEKDKGEFELA